jgi:endonuclease/exonuclease/phosphatase (EEP) superfamily protein YafD
MPGLCNTKAIMNWIYLCVVGLGGLAVVTSILPMWHTPRWWVRIWDFPRFQIAVVAMILAVVALTSRWPGASFDWLFLFSMLGVLAWQLTWVGPYIPGAPRAVKACAKSSDTANRIRVLTTNVLQNNRGVDRLLEIIRQADPDVAFAVEVDEWWVDRLSAGLDAKYPYNLIYPLSNGYGLALYSRLELIDPQVRFVLDEAIPSIRTGVRLRSGLAIAVYGVHPRPPSVQQDSTERDVELLRVAHEIKERGVPSIVLGDLNDVAWSPTTLNFMRSGNLSDPRRGRGFYNTYPARWPGLRYPLDYIFSTKHVSVGAMRVLPAFGSDHLPLVAELFIE